MSYSAFSKHFDSMVKTYKRVLMFDLLSATKQGEVVLSQAYRENALVYEKRPAANIKYCHFDFHKERENSVWIACFTKRRRATWCSGWWTSGAKCSTYSHTIATGPRAATRTA
ncbi:MAG: hypothetical protein P4M11_04025, partial [Candidatus Pacebacteria bacterium]|nr:hypothetical protein [Candidatus Paceibacterota bacterium]